MAVRSASTWPFGHVNPLRPDVPPSERRPWMILRTYHPGALGVEVSYSCTLYREPIRNLEPKELELHDTDAPAKPLQHFSSVPSEDPRPSVGTVGHFADRLIQNPTCCLHALA